MFIYLYFTVEIFIMKLGSVPHLMFQILRDIGPVCVTLNALSPSLTDFSYIVCTCICQYFYHELQYIAFSYIN